MEYGRYNYEQCLHKFNMAVCLTGTDGIVVATSKAASENIGVHNGDDMKKYLIGDADRLFESLCGEDYAILAEILIEQIPFIEYCTMTHFTNPDTGDELVMWFFFDGISSYLNQPDQECRDSFKRFITEITLMSGGIFAENMRSSKSGRKHSGYNVISGFAEMLGTIYLLFPKDVSVRNNAPLCEVNRAMEIIRRMFLEYGCHTGFLAEVEAIGLSEKLIAESMTHLSDEEYISRWASDEMPVIFTKYPELERGAEALPDFLSGFPAEDSTGNKYSFFLDFTGMFSFVSVIAFYAQYSTDNGRAGFEIGMDSWHDDSALIMTAEYKIQPTTDNDSKSRKAKRKKLFEKHMNVLSKVNVYAGFNYEVAMIPDPDENIIIKFRVVMPVYAIRDSESGISRHDSYRPLEGFEMNLLRGVSAILQMFGSVRTFEPYPERLIGK